jgi:hypothetical protein
VIFRNPPDINYRAVRDMGLAAWFGGSLMNLAGLVPASESQPDPEQRHRVLDAGLRGSRGLLTGAISAYLLGTGLVRFDGRPFDANGAPKWIASGVESAPRTAVTVVALCAALTAKRLRDKSAKILESQRTDSGAVEEAEKLRMKAHLMHVVVPAATGWLLYSHLKQDMLRK